MHAFDRAIINSAACLLPNASHLAQHFQTIAGHVNFAALGMVPAHGNFLEPQTGAVSDIKQLHVETETIDGRTFDNRPAGAHAKSFEATLRVPKGKTGRQSHREVENATTLFAQQ